MPGKISKVFHYVIYKIQDKSLTKYYRWLGANIGNDCSFIGSNISLSSEPYLITIGNHVRVSFDVAFVTHDGGTFVLRDKHPNVSIYGKIKVGDNVFIGARSIIMPNVTIGNNCIIAAGCIVTREVPDNTVVAGIPAKPICSIEEYYEKHKGQLMKVADYTFEKKKAILLDKLN